MIFPVATGIAITAILILIDVKKTTAEMLRKLRISPEQEYGLSEDKS